MTTKTLYKALRQPKPAVIKERGAPRYVVLDWKTYDMWREQLEDFEDTARLFAALADPKNQKRTSLATVKKRYHIS